MSWLWYLANDMQFFILMPFIVFAFIKNRLIGYFIPTVIVIANFGVTTGLAFYYEADPNPFMGTYFLNMYLKPWV